MIKAQARMDRGLLPPALRPFDAELSFNDITSHGIHIAENSVSGAITQITMTVNTRRPPRFFTEFETSGKFIGRTSGKRPYRRRATAMDFAIADAVRFQ